METLVPSDAVVLLLGCYGEAAGGGPLPYCRRELHKFLFDRRSAYPRFLGWLVFDTKGWHPIAHNFERAIDATQMAKLAGKPNPEYDEIAIKPQLLDRYAKAREKLSAADIDQLGKLVSELLGVASGWKQSSSAR